MILFQCHNLCWTSQCTSVTFQAVGMQIAYFLAARIVRSELHRAYTGTLLTLHLTRTRHVDIGKCLGQRGAFRSHPVRDSPHRAERAPCAWRIDERQHHTDDGSHNNYRPKHTTYAAPHSQPTLAPWNGECQLKAEHTEDEAHHEQAETESAQKLWNRTMR